MRPRGEGPSLPNASSGRAQCAFLVQERPIHDYIHLGTVIRYLQDAQPGWRVHDAPDGRHCILTNLRHLRRELDASGLVVTRRAAEPLLAFEDALSEGAPPDAVLGKEGAGRIQQAASVLRATLEAEAKGKVAFVATAKRYDVTQLTRDVSRVFAEGVYARLPPIAQHDFAEAGKCVAFERATAAAFHALRGVEAVLRALHARVVPASRACLWKPMVDELRAALPGPAHRPLLDHLDNLRASFRNPTQHPEKVYGIEEAQDLLALCADAVNRMVGSGHWPSAPTEAPAA